MASQLLTRSEHALLRGGGPTDVEVVVVAVAPGGSLGDRRDKRPVLVPDVVGALRPAALLKEVLRLLQSILGHGLAHAEVALELQCDPTWSLRQGHRHRQHHRRHDQIPNVHAISSIRPTMRPLNPRVRRPTTLPGPRRNPEPTRRQSPATRRLATCCAPRRSVSIGGMDASACPRLQPPRAVFHDFSSLKGVNPEVGGGPSRRNASASGTRDRLSTGCDHLRRRVVASTHSNGNHLGRSAPGRSMKKGPELTVDPDDSPTASCPVRTIVIPEPCPCDLPEFFP